MRIILLTLAKDDFEVTSFNRLTQEAKSRGHTLERVRYSECSMTIENDLPKMFYRGKELHGVDAVIPWIIQGNFDYGIEVVRHFESMRIYVLNTSESIVNAAYKWRTAQILSKADISIANTYRAHEDSLMHKHIETMDNDQSVIKTDAGAFGSNVFLSENKSAAKTMASTLSKQNGGYIIQEYIAESAGEDIRILVLDNQIIASMKRQNTNGDFRSNLYQGGVGTAVKVTEKEAEVALKSAQALGLKVCGVDLVRSTRGSLVLELNSTPGFKIEKVTDCNVAAKIIICMENNAK